MAPEVSEKSAPFGPNIFVLSKITNKQIWHFYKVKFWPKPNKWFTAYTKLWSFELWGNWDASYFC